MPGARGRRPPIADDQGARRALARRRRRRKIRLGIVWTACVMVLTGVGGGFVMGGSALVGLVRTHTRLTRVRAVDPGTTRWVPPWEIVEMTGVEPGDDLLAVDPDSVAARVERHPRVARAQVIRGWDRVLRIEVVERPPVALWMGDRVLEVAADGTVLGPAPERGREWPVPARGPDPRGLELPLLTGVLERGIPVGGHLRGAGAREALAFLARLRAYGLGGESWLSEVWAGEPENLVGITLDGGIPVRLGDGRLGPRKVEALRTVLTRVHKDDDPVAYVDARFRHQVVVKSS